MTMTALEQPFQMQDAAEVNWSGKTVMAVFLAITLVSAVFFGLGYSFGRGLSIVGAPALAAMPIASEGAAAASTAPAAVHRAALRAATATQNHAMQPAPAHHAPAPARSPHVQATAMHYMVQVGVVTQRKDAQRLQAALAHRGYHAGIYATNRGRLLHVQIGPLSSLAQAQTVRHRVQASGFHAILMHG
jgi:cell division septation protein DedD